MEKVYKAIEEQPNKWRKKVSWKLSKNDVASLVLFTTITGLVVIRVLIG